MNKIIHERHIYLQNKVSLTKLLKTENGKIILSIQRALLKVDSTPLLPPPPLPVTLATGRPPSPFPAQQPFSLIQPYTSCANYQGTHKTATRATASIVHTIRHARLNHMAAISDATFSAFDLASFSSFSQGTKSGRAYECDVFLTFQNLHPR